MTTSLSRGLSLRITFVVLAMTLTGVLSTFAATAVATREALQATLIDSGDGPEARAALARCDDAPATFARVDDRGTRFHAYDREGAALSLDAPPIDAELLSRLRSGEALPSRMSGSEVRWLIARPGRCALVMGRWEGSFGHRRTLVRILAVSLVSTLSIAALLVLFVIVRPLRARIAALRDAAASVGSSDGYRAAPMGSDDDLDVLGSSIDAAHRRIVADTTRLRANRDELKRFLGDVAHDVRTPITAIRLLLEELDDALRHGRDARARLPRLFDEIVYVGSLTDNLLIASRLEGGWDPMEGDPETDLVTVVSRVAQREEIFARRKQVTLHVAHPDGPLHARADPTLVEQAITNMAENAIAHGHEGGHVALRLERLDDGRFEVSVEDDGPGARLEELPRLGERNFRTAEARQRAPKGSGLGLAIVRAVAERAGWSVAVTTLEPSGLRVSIEGALLAPSRRRGPRE